MVNDNSFNSLKKTAEFYELLLFDSWIFHAAELHLSKWNFNECPGLSETLIEFQLFELALKNTFELCIIV